MKCLSVAFIKKIAHQAAMAVFAATMIVIFLFTFASYCDFGLHASQIEMEASEPN